MVFDVSPEIAAFGLTEPTLPGRNWKDLHPAEGNPDMFDRDWDLGLETSALGDSG